MSKSVNDIYGGQNPLDIPAYSFGEAAHYLRLPLATVRLRCLGQHYSTSRGRKRSAHLIDLPDPSGLSFRNMVELHVLSAIRRKHGVKMPAVRKAINYLQKCLRIDHPLTSEEMTTDGKDLFIERYGNLVNVSRGGQFEMKELIAAYLTRIDHDKRGLPIRLFPYTRQSIDGAPKLVAMSPTIQFGRPCIVGTGIPTAIIAERYYAGDAIEFLAKDYGQEVIAIEEAIRCESRAA